jgi:hypothetical protein
MTPTGVLTAFGPHVTAPTCQAGFGAGVRVATSLGWEGPQAAGFGPEPGPYHAQRASAGELAPIREAPISAAITPRTGSHVDSKMVFSIQKAKIASLLIAHWRTGRVQYSCREIPLG